MRTRAQILGENLKRIRENRSISRKDLAEIIGITEIAFGKYERGEVLPPLDKIFKIADYLKVSVSTITGENNFSANIPNVEETVNKKIFEYRLKKALEVAKAADCSVKIERDETVTVKIELNFVKDFKDAKNYSVVAKEIVFSFESVENFVKTVEKTMQYSLVPNFSYAFRNMLNEVARGTKDEDLKSIVICHYKE